RQWHADVRSLLQLRQRTLFALLRHGSQRGEATVDGDTLRLCWPLGAQGQAGRLSLLAHFGTGSVGDVAPVPGRVLFSLGPEPQPGGPWTLTRGAVVLSFDGPDHG
ncbi:MAG: DUF3459 domain-containing protein, partial [Rhodoferax sp.]|nr:DUF3459 domain-containing protein [Rhodoferax sp.]